MCTGHRGTDTLYPFHRKNWYAPGTSDELHRVVVPLISDRRLCAGVIDSRKVIGRPSVVPRAPILLL